MTWAWGRKLILVIGIEMRLQFLSFRVLLVCWGFFKWPYQILNSLILAEKTPGFFPFSNCLRTTLLLKHLGVFFCFSNST